MLKVLEGLNFKGLKDVSPEQLRDAAIALHRSTTRSPR